MVIEILKKYESKNTGIPPEKIFKFDIRELILIYLNLLILYVIKSKYMKI